MLSVPVEAVRAALPAAAAETLHSEARLRMLLALPAFIECSAPVEKLRALSSATRLRQVRPPLSPYPPNPSPDLTPRPLPLSHTPLRHVRAIGAARHDAPTGG